MNTNDYKYSPLLSDHLTSIEFCLLYFYQHYFYFSINLKILKLINLLIQEVAFQGFFSVCEHLFKHWNGKLYSQQIDKLKQREIILVTIAV